MAKRQWVHLQQPRAHAAPPVIYFIWLKTQTIVSFIYYLVDDTFAVRVPNCSLYTKIL